jgi:methionyl aminopeptidase
MVFAIEPMFNMGGPRVRVDKDGWTVRTGDGNVSAHFEFTVALFSEGAVILGTGSLPAARAAAVGAAGR